MPTKSTISELLARLVVDVDNMNAFLFSLQNMLESNSESVSITQRLDDGTTKTINVPSFGYLKGKIDDVNTNFDTLVSANDSVICIKSSNGDVRKFELKKVSKLIQELEDIKTTSLTVPNSFGVKNNWFFESFLNPLLFVSIDISTILTSDIDQFSVKRIIVNSNDEDEQAYFDSTYKGVNSILLSDLKLDLDDRGIDYFEDDNVADLGTAVNRYKGSFDVLNIFDETVNQTVESTGATFSVARRRYKLSTLTYTDILDGVEDTKILAEGNVLITDNDSEYRVLSVNITDREIVLERIFGIEPITIGADILRIKPVPYRTPELQINVGFNERQVIFIKPISRANNITIDDYSNGFGVFTNELTITLQDDSQSTLEQYYNNFVADFGLILLNSAKEKKIPAVIGESPIAPIPQVNDFKVSQVDLHIKEDEDETAIRNQISEKENLKVRIKENTKKIEQLKAQLNDSQKTQSEKSRIEKSIKKSAEERSTLQTQLSSAVQSISTSLSTNGTFTRESKYRIRGFWPIPDAKDSRYGKQEVVQFKVRYRYLSKKGTAPNVEQSTVTTDGQSTFAAFSPWTEYLTKPRTKVLDETTGLYTWSSEDLTSSEAVNANQLEIPIRKGETVEFQIKSLSEAGWPDNPVESDWSDPVQIPFPEELSGVEDSVLLSQRALIEESQVNFQDELNSIGLDLHLANQFTTGERFFAHKAEDISSGFFTPEGNVVDLYAKIKEMQSVIDALKESISTAKGTIKVSIIDGEGNSSEIKNGETVKLFAGYYRDQIKDTSAGSIVYNEGRVITKQYLLSIENTSVTPLELISILQGGINEVAPQSDPILYPDSDYHINRRYDIVPISTLGEGSSILSDFKQAGTNQTGQVKSQYVYSRFKNYGLSDALYQSYPSTGYITNTSYDYDGITVGSSLVPLDYGHYLPFRPQLAIPSTSTNSKIWNGTTTSGTVNGGGFLTEFCIHTDHPDLKNLGTSDVGTLSPSAIADRKNFFAPRFKELTAAPLIDSDATQASLKFYHAPFFETSENEKIGVLGNNHYSQASRVAPLAITAGDNTNRDNSNYPIKIGFSSQDEYLIGKYTCGSYLYAYPNTYSDVSVDGNVIALSNKKVNLGSENAINLPILFQYRCSDKLGNVGGFRISGPLKNIKYSKKIGIDIYVKNDVPFSFDLEVGTQYKKETTLDSPIVPSKGKVSVNF